MIDRIYRIVVIFGDGIGCEVMLEGLCVFVVVIVCFGVCFDFVEIDWVSCDYYVWYGKMMLDDWKVQLLDMDVILFGVVGWLVIVFDYILLWGLLLKFCCEFDQYINLWFVCLFDGVLLLFVGCCVGDIDFMIVCENIEGEYLLVGGMMFEGIECEVVMQQLIFMWYGIECVLKFVFEFVQWCVKCVIVVMKSNGIVISMLWWDVCVVEMVECYLEIVVDKQYIDILCVCFVL